MDFWWLYGLAGVAIIIAAIIARKNSKETGVSFARSFFYAVLLILGITFLILTAITGGKQ